MPSRTKPPRNPLINIIPSRLILHKCPLSYLLNFKSLQKLLCYSKKLSMASDTDKASHMMNMRNAANKQLEGALGIGKIEREQYRPLKEELGIKIRELSQHIFYLTDCR